MKRFLSLILASATVLSLSSCNKDESNNSAQQGPNPAAMKEGSPDNGSDGASSEKQSEGAEQSSKGKPNPTQGASAKGSNSDNTSADSKQPQQPAQSVTSQHNIHPGQVGGDCGTTNQGDQITAGSQTSCEMAAAMFDAAMASNFYAWTPDPTVTKVARTEVSVHSPVTNDTYELTCFTASSGTDMTCGKPTGAPYYVPSSKNPLSGHFHTVGVNSFWKRINLQK